MSPKHFVPALFVLLLGATGCMTMLNGTGQQVHVVTYPIKAAVRVADLAGNVVYEGPTPAKVKLSRSTRYEITAGSDGYRPAKVVAVPRTTRDNLWGSCLLNIFGGGVGFFVDLASGSLKSFDEEGIELTLLREKAPVASIEPDIEVLLTTNGDFAGTPLVYAEILR